MRLQTIKIILSCLVVFTGFTAHAAIDDDWQAGKAAFTSGDYESALVFFQLARDAGLDTAAVHYNIGVSQFRLGRYSDSRRTFVTVARHYPQMRGLAEYNLGLIARRLGNDADAREHFLSAYDLSPDDRKIRVLASRNLREIEPDVQIASRWSGVVGVRAGYDDNVALRDEAGLPVGTTTDSPMTDAFASFSGPWSGRSGFRVEGSAYLVHYVDADDFDQSQISGGVFYDWRPDKWRFQLGLQASTISLAGDAYDRKAGVRARAVRYLAPGASIDVRYVQEEVSEADPLFIGIDGTRQQFDARYNWYRDGHVVQLRYWLETNDRLDPAVSPERNRFALYYGMQPESGLGYEAAVDIRNSDYDELATPREEDLLTLRGAITYRFRSNWLVQLEYQNANNDSTDETFSYDRSKLVFGAIKIF